MGPPNPSVPSSKKYKRNARIPGRVAVSWSEAKGLFIFRSGCAVISPAHRFPPRMGRDLRARPAGYRLVRHLVARRTLAQFVESGLESGSKFFSRTSAPIMEKDHDRAIPRHVVVNGNDIQAVLTKRFQDRRHFAFEHRHIPRN